MLCLGAALALSCAHAAQTPVSKPLNANADLTRSTKYPCLLADQSDCSAPLATSLTWSQTCLDTALGGLTNVQVGTPGDFSIDSCLTGTNHASATLSFVQSSDNVTSCFSDFSVTGASPNRKLHDAATLVGGGTCALKATFSGASAISNTRSWNNISPVGGDGSPATQVTGVTCTGGTLSATCTFDAQMDPDTGVVRSGVANYKVYSDLTWIDTLAAATPGLNCSFTAQTIGAAVAGSPSATQGSGFSGTQWTIAGRGYGLEAADSYYGVSCPAAGSAVYAIAQITSISAAATYDKAPVDIRNSTSTTSAHYACPLMRQVIGGATTYYLQRTMRAADGGSNTNGSVALSGSPPFWVRASVVNNSGACDYSTDGGAWTTVVSGDPITLNDSKIVVFGGSATNTGADDAAVSVVYGSAAVQTAGRLSKTVTLAAGTHSLKVSSVDVTGNESGLNAGASVTVSSGAAGTHKFFPGHYVRAHTHNLSCGTACDAQRHSLYSNFMGQTNVVGTEIWIDWKFMESDAGNDFSAGISWLTNEIAYVNSTYPGKKIGLLMNIAPYGYTGLTGAPNTYPQYFINAGCVYNENSAGSGGGTSSLNWFKNNPTCLNYYNRLIAAYGAAFDGNSTLAFVRIQQETDDAINCCGISGTAEDTAWKNMAQAAVTAFPTTPIWVPFNWAGVNTAANVESLLLYYKSIQSGVGNGDTQPLNLAYSCPATAWVCVVLGLNASIGGTNHSNCGEFVSLGAVELSEMGYNSVTDPFGGLTSQQVATSWNNDTCQQFGIWEPNFGEIGSSDTQYWNGAHGQLWAINNFPITHTSKPAGYQ